jgi:adenylosuccinate lyase
LETVVNVLADRYASEAMKATWSPEGRIRLERELWIAVMKAQKCLGLEIPQEAISAYEKVKDQVDLPSIKAREKVTRHDVKARIEEFCDLAGHEQIHKGMTSRDLTENVEQLQVFRSLQLVRSKTIATLGALAAKAKNTGTSSSPPGPTTSPPSPPPWVNGSPCSARKCSWPWKTSTT